MKLKITGAQFAVTDDVQANLAAIKRAIEKAAAENADILLTPEGSLSGYRHDFNQNETKEALAETERAALEAGVGLALGTCLNEKDGRCYNEIRVYDKGGQFLGFHAKKLLCGRPEDLATSEFRHFGMKPLGVFQTNGITFGCLICNDLWANPQWTPGDDTHLTRQLAAMGAGMVLHAVNSGIISGVYDRAVQAYHESNLSIRANANRLWIATVNSCYNGKPCSCSRGVISPDGVWVVRLPNTGEHSYSYTMELA